MFFKRATVFFNIVIPVVLGILLLSLYLERARKAYEIGLGEEADFYVPAINNYPIVMMELATTDSMKKGWELRGSHEPVLWLGNSQLTGMNQYKKGQKNCVEFLFDSLATSHKEALGGSFPNANFQEFLLSVIYLTNQLPVKNIVIPVFYDDMREAGIRNEMKIPQVVKCIGQPAFQKYYQGLPDLIALADTSLNVVEATSDMKALDQTAQEYSEKYLNRVAENNWDLWARRPDARAKIFNDLYKLRNAALGIKATTVRKMIPARYDDNHRAFLAVLDYCRDMGIKVFVYIPPLRSDIAPPYDMNAYRQFKQLIEADCKKPDVYFFDLENMVPAKYWGRKRTTTFGAQEIDFMHFQEPGHFFMADTMYRIFKKIQ